MFEPILLNFAYGLLLVAAFTRTLSRFRLLIIASSVGFVIFGFILDSLPIIVWNAVIAGLNTFRLARSVAATRGITLTDEEREVRDRYFHGTNDFDFNALWVMGRRVELDSGTIIEAGSQPELVSMVLDGRVEIRVDGEDSHTLRRGALIGEMSYVTGDPASVDVVAVAPVTMWRWEQRQLRTLEETHPPSAKVLDRLISSDLAAKVRS